MCWLCYLRTTVHGCAEASATFKLCASLEFVCSCAQLHVQLSLMRLISHPSVLLLQMNDAHTMEIQQIAYKRDAVAMVLPARCCLLSKPGNRRNCVHHEDLGVMKYLYTHIHTWRVRSTDFCSWSPSTKL